MLCLAIDLKVIAERSGKRHVATTQTQDTIRQFQFLQQTLYVLEHLFVTGVRVLGGINTYDLDLRELVQTIQSAYVLAVRACLTTETLGIGTVLDRQLDLIQDDVAIEVRYGHLSRRDQIEVIHLAVVHLTLLVGQLTRAVTRSGVHHRRRHDLRIAGLVGLSQEEIDQRTLQTSTLSDIDRETGARDLDAQVEIDEVVLLSQFPVRGECLATHIFLQAVRSNSLIGCTIPVAERHSTIARDGVDHGLVGPVADSNSQVILGSCAFGHDVVGNVRDSEQQLGLRLLGIRHLSIKFGNLGLERTGLCLSGLSLLALALSHEHADRLADAVHLGRRSILMLLGRLTLGVETEDILNNLCCTSEVLLLQARNDTGFIVVDLF